jgi:hypothetical protein
MKLVEGDVTEHRMAERSAAADGIGVPPAGPCCLQRARLSQTVNDLGDVTFT